MNAREERILRDYRIVLSCFVLADPELVRQVRTALAMLEMVSHGASLNYGGVTARSATARAGPTGGDQEPRPRDFEERAGWHESYLPKSVSYFRWRVAGCRTLADLATVRTDVQRAVECWRRQPLPVGQEPEYGSPQWKRWVAESAESSSELGRRFNVSARYIRMIRQAYASKAEPIGSP